MLNFSRFDKKKPYFQGVAIATLLCGAAIVALGIVELGMNLWSSGTYSEPTLKIIGGLAVTSLGYVHLELEMLRVK